MKKLTMLFAITTMLFISSCDMPPENRTAVLEQAKTEENQQGLLASQPPPKLTWSLERDNLIKRFKLMNDRTINFYMYIFIEGISEPIGYYEVNKVSSVNSQLTNTMQMVDDPHGTTGVGSCVLPSPAEDGSYGENGSAIFGFTPEEIYIESNMKYITSSVPLSFQKPVNRLAIIGTPEAKAILEASKKAMNK